MLKSEVQHQFWITKKAVQRKLGSKEDKHIISSDAELDAKIEVFKSISDTSLELCKIIDQYQERLCILSQEECVFGRFLKEAGKRSKTTGNSINHTAKAMSFAGQQRMCVRVPLLRLQHEVDVFRCRAVKDTEIDLLAAARCNMYSHALVAYVAELKSFAQKAASTFQTISNALIAKPKYDFCVLKELSQNEGPSEDVPPIEAVDKDQSLFFASEYQDKPDSELKPPSGKKSQAEPAPVCGDNESLLIELAKQLEKEDSPLIDAPVQEQESPLMGDANQTSSTNSKFWARMFNPQLQQQQQKPMPTTTTTTAAKPAACGPAPATASAAASKSQSTNNPWLDLFADLDPPGPIRRRFDLKMSGGRSVAEQT
ncbi:GL20778 [Drosophila persimilis]|uniref:GL20778 n=1 Tax=Drosophila persimilis TaxID=7234 RepID=B4H400_DROPE|nr:GL20778 [Drosophila persimilis]